MAEERTAKFEVGGLAVFLALITAALLFIAWPFLSALLWAALAAIMFQPLFRRMDAVLPGHENWAALLTLLIITVAIVIPALIIGSIVLDEAIALYVDLRGREIDTAGLVRGAWDALPGQARTLLAESGYDDPARVRAQLTEFVRTSAGVVATYLLALGGSALSWLLSFGVALYATFFLLRDGPHVGAQIERSLPLRPGTSRKLAESFVRSVRATVKGSVVVGLVQGALGAITFWIVGLPSVFLFGMLMAIFSLLPAVGPAIVWGPAAIYLFATGAIWEGIVVLASGVLVIGMADNLLRPVLVGRDTGLPDWVVLVTTLGGIASLGLSGIIVGPVVAGLFLTGWAVLRHDREIAPR